MSILHNPRTRLTVLLALIVVASLFATVAQAQEATTVGSGERTLRPISSRGFRGWTPTSDTAMIGIWSIQIEAFRKVSIQEAEGTLIGIVMSGTVEVEPRSTRLCVSASCHSFAPREDFVLDWRGTSTIANQSPQQAVVHLMGLVSTTPVLVGDGSIEVIAAHLVEPNVPEKRIDLTLAQYSVLPGYSLHLTPSAWPALVLNGTQDGTVTLNTVPSDSDTSDRGLFATPSNGSSMASVYVPPDYEATIDVAADGIPVIIVVLSIDETTFDPMPGCSGRCMYF